MLRLILSSTLLLLTINIIHGKQLLATAKGCIGAVYTSTTGRIKNEVIVNCLYANGSLKVVGRVDTDGVGINYTDLDPLFSSGRMVVQSNYLFVINPGSDSLSMLRINPSDATKLTLLSVKQVYGFFPVSVTVNSKYACVLTGGHITGIRCFTYNSRGLKVVPSFDRDLTKYISQTIPLTTVLDTMSEIKFTADNHALIISKKGNPSKVGYLLFFRLNSRKTKLSLKPIKQRPPNAVLTFSLELVGENGLLITDPGRNLMSTMTYSSKLGLIDNGHAAWVNASIATLICWSAYSSRTGNYYIIAALPAAVIEVEVNLCSPRFPMKIVRYYLLPPDDIALDTRVVSLPDSDYLYVVTARHDLITAYKLVSAGNAKRIGRFRQQKDYGGGSSMDFSDEDIDLAEKISYADPHPPGNGPIVPPPSFLTTRTEPVLTGLAAYLHDSSSD